jgi:putative hemolysin
LWNARAIGRRIVDAASLLHPRDHPLLVEVLAALVLIALNGVFALSELAIVSSRLPRLTAMAKAGRRGAGTALVLARNPGRFLSTVQVGITLVGILAGAFSGAALGERLAGVLRQAGMGEALAEGLGYGLIVAAMTYLSVIVGELVPKHLALRDPEKIACAVAPAMTFLSRAAGPVVSLLDASTRAVFRAFGQEAAPQRTVTDEEIRTLVAEAESAGTIETAERQMIAGVLRLGDRSARGIMTPRTEVELLDMTGDEGAFRATLAATRHSVLPVVEGDPDNVIGVVQARDLVAASMAGGALNLRALVRPAPVVPDTIDALDVVRLLREAEVPVALVHDEYGHFEGLVTPADALKAIVGAFRADHEAREPPAVRRDDGSWLLAGSMPADEMAEHLGITLPAERDYETVAGLVIDRLGHLPETGEAADTFGWRFEVVDLDGRRIDKVLASRPPARLRGAATASPTR